MGRNSDATAKSQLPMPGSHSELGTGLVDKTLKDLGLK
jgi:hypothetical protein